MAEFFWLEGSNPVSAALAAYKLLKKMSKHTEDSSERHGTILKNAE